MESPFSLSGRTLLITGASSGIGKAIAQQCAIAGGACILVARNENRLRDVLTSLKGVGHKYVCSDLSTLEGINRVIDYMPKCDGIVCAAGIVDTTVFRQTEDDDILKMFNINTFSIIRLLREALKNKKIKNSASLVIISSISGVKCGYIGGALYGASKGALDGLIKPLALELAPRKIRVNAITPGMIETNILRNSNIGMEQLEEDKKKYPLKRYGTPEEIGYASVYLLSDASSWVTGSSLLLDGGYTIQ